MSVAAIIAQAAVNEGLQVRQSEVHGMAQRGGAVLAHLRISDSTIPSDLVPRGGADIILSMEPLESLRYVSWLSPKGALVCAAEPFINIPNYPDLEGILNTIKQFPEHRIVEAEALAKKAGLAKSVNMVMVGAASAFLPVKTSTLEAAITEMFAAKNTAAVDSNIKAFNYGRNAAQRP